MDFTGAYNHVRLRLNERFNLDITYEEYLNRLVIKRDYVKKDKEYKKIKKYLIGDIVYTYYIGKRCAYPITCYFLDKRNQGSISKKIDIEVKYGNLENGI